MRILKAILVFLAVVSLTNDAVCQKTSKLYDKNRQLIAGKTHKLFANRPITLSAREYKGWIAIEDSFLNILVKELHYPQLMSESNVDGEKCVFSFKYVAKNNTFTVHALMVDTANIFVVAMRHMVLKALNKTIVKFKNSNKGELNEKTFYLPLKFEFEGGKAPQNSGVVLSDEKVFLDDSWFCISIKLTPFVERVYR